MRSVVPDSLPVLVLRGSPGTPVRLLVVAILLLLFLLRICGQSERR